MNEYCFIGVNTAAEDWPVRTGNPEREILPAGGEGRGTCYH